MLNISDSGSKILKDTELYIMGNNDWCGICPLTFRSKVNLDAHVGRYHQETCRQFLSMLAFNIHCNKTKGILAQDGSSIFPFSLSRQYNTSM